MSNARYDAFLRRVLRRSREEVAFITPDYDYDLSAALVWVTAGSAHSNDDRETIRIKSSPHPAPQVIAMGSHMGRLLEGDV